MELNSEKEKIIDLLGKMFQYADEEQWIKFEKEIFDKQCYIDIVAINGIKGNFSPFDASQLWKSFSGNLDGIHRKLGDVLVTINGNEAELFTNATLSHIKKNSTKGVIREYIGNYQIKFHKTGDRWFINTFIYNIDHKIGNVNFE